MRDRIAWRIFLLLSAFVTLLGPALATAPTSFCKCTCFGNSTIIPLDLPVTVGGQTQRAPAALGKKTCNDCNRQFCLTQGKNTFCKGEKEEKVFSTCFQRDSAKDQAVVYIFIIATVGLLSYAAVRPWIERWAERARERQTYIPVSGQADH